MIPEVRGEEGNLPPADSLKQKRAQLGHINKMITLITSKRGKPENIQLKLKECLAKARACGDDPFLEKFSKHVDNFTGYTPQKKTKPPRRVSRNRNTPKNPPSFEGGFLSYV